MQKVWSKKQAFQWAIKEARKAMGRVSPNPAVGCIILDKNFHLIGKGHTQKPGSDHAEVQAIKSIKDGESRLTGAHVFVTLEPCAHQGRTGSCAQLLAQYPIDTLYYGELDPNPLVNGKGLSILQDKGIKTVSLNDEFSLELEKLYEAFFCNQKQKMTFVSLKMAASLDGKVALQNGESQWITSESARVHAHWIRSIHDALITGVNTFLHDDPKMNIRHGPLAGKEMKVIILDPKGRSISKINSSNLLKTHHPKNVFVVIDKSQCEVIKESMEFNVIEARTLESGSIDLSQLLKQLYSDYGICSVLVEAGGVTNSEFLQQKTVHRIYNYMAPVFLGQGLSGTENYQLSRLSDKTPLQKVQFKKLGPDFLITGKL